MSAVNLVLAVSMMALITFGQKAIPFVTLGTFKDNKTIAYLAQQLPPAVMLILVVYALQTQWVGFSKISLIPIISSLFTAIIHLLFRQTLASISAGVIMFAILKKLLI